MKRWWNVNEGGNGNRNIEVRNILLIALVMISTLCIRSMINESSLFMVSWNLDSIQWIERQVEYAFVPQLACVKYQEEDVALDWIFEQAMSMNPILHYYEEDTVLVQAEDTITDEWILLAQAMDENYIDTTGELVGEEVVIEPNTDDYEVLLDIENVESMEKLEDLDYILSNYYVVDKTVAIDETIFNPVEWVEEDLSLAEGVEGPQILIYHTHSQEDFVDSVAGDSSTTIVGVGAYLAEVLEEEYGVEVLHHEGVYDLVDGVLDRSNAYDLAYDAVTEILEENPSIEMVIDLHRDGVDQHTHLVTMIDGEATAQIMYFNGLSSTISTGSISYLENPYIEDNLTLTFQMQLASEELYPGFSRRIYLKSYRYNLHLMPKTMLIEAGAQTNTLEEMYNAMDVLAEVLSVVVGL